MLALEYRNVFIQARKFANYSSLSTNVVLLAAERQSGERYLFIDVYDATELPITDVLDIAA